METAEAVFLSQIPIGIGVIIAIYELYRLRKAVERIAGKK